MFKPNQIPAIAKAHELISSQSQVRHIDTEGNEKVVHLRGYSHTGEHLGDSLVRVTDWFNEGEYTFPYIVELIEHGMMVKEV